ncbi:UDP-N-acetylmuramoyl-L-alanine--D-glutamate ligase [Paenibacillus hemerocallicola]|uniref:UDP-N-acetylmuramoylalanine--D-glutamate ligase n=1 Tax=Paenibacillus hemerocallicola TaxID=1172614 RepID=A0A5C4TBP3_9BACL|nr:UDP-N-acetylmuramoyl-L-alanine--D-glutamate ligase [Paenibacillus hemerocallicola]TNJ66341.1 UDP-N-acetylmuramoyl-L-alanine--D-glutamate ligase [Paenibacillus hemerocallicola]
MNHPEFYRGKEVVVLGLARSGVAVAKLFHEYGAAVTVNDKKDRTLCPEADELTALGISVLCGGHPETLIHAGVALVVKNPGIPYSIPPVRDAERLGIEIVTEVEVANYICKAPIIGITGSNGKTTTTTWIGRILENAGLHPIIAGNIGRALCEAAAEATGTNHMVVELSSFQLKGTVNFRPRIACLLNVCETHLDYHGTMEDYIASKAKLFASQRQDDVAVLNWDDPECRRIAGTVKAQLVPFSMRERLERGVYLEPPLQSPDEPLTDAHHIVHKDAAGRETVVLPAKQLGIPGKHNAENAMAAVAVALAAGADLDSIVQALRTFRGVEHRLEFVLERDGIVYYNNSKATNSLATMKALESFGQPIVLIAGGQDRKSEFQDLLPYLERNVKAVVSLGETRHKFAGLAEKAGISAVKTVDTGNSAAETLDEAVRAARAFAESGDVVLLSPACASWDMFESFEIRGRMFKESVHKL